MVFLNTNTHKNPPWGKGKAGKSAQTQSWLSKHTYLFFHKETRIVEWRQHGFIYSTPGGVWQCSQSLNQSSAGHNSPTMYFREQSVGAGISSDAESRNSNLAEPRSVLSSSRYLGLPGPQVVLAAPPTFSLLLILFSPFPFFRGSDLHRLSVGNSDNLFPPRATSPFLGMTPVAGDHHRTLFLLFHFCRKNQTTSAWQSALQDRGQWGRFRQICVYATFSEAEGCFSSGF